MRIAYVTTYDAGDIRKFSGSATFMARALQQPPAELTFIGGLRERLSFPFKVKQQFYRSVLGLDHHRDREPIILRHYGRQVAERLGSERPDYLFSPSTIPLAYASTDVPVAFWTDATFGGLVDYYPEFTDLSPETLRNGHRMEGDILHRCRLAFYSSDWAARSAVDLYGADPDRVRVVPFGANLDDPPSDERAAACIADRPDDRCRLVFIGLDWQRKGGETALEAARLLNERGLPTRLTVIGCTPPPPHPDFVHGLGFVSKASPEGRQRIERALAEAHFLILPTEADCTPIVLCEANAYGVPCLAADTGGLPTIIRNGRNGRLFSRAEGAEPYADEIEARFQDYAGYRRLAADARQEYAGRLNWAAAGQTVLQHLEASL